MLLNVFSSSTGKSSEPTSAFVSRRSAVAAPDGNGCISLSIRAINIIVTNNRRADKHHQVALARSVEV